MTKLKLLQQQQQQYQQQLFLTMYETEFSSQNGFVENGGIKISF